MSVMSACIIPIAKADGLYSEKFDMTKVKADKTDGVTKEVEVPDGDKCPNCRDTFFPFNP